MTRYISNCDQHLLITIVSVYAAEGPDCYRVEVLLDRTQPFSDWEERGSDKQNLDPFGQVNSVWHSSQLETPAAA